MSQSSMYLNFKKSLAAVGALLLVIPVVASAETVVRTGGTVSIGVSQVVENDFYAAGGSVTHSGEIKGDMFVTAGSVTVNGKVGEDLTVFGGTVGVNSLIGDDLRVGGGEVTLAGEVKGDVFVLGGQLRVLSSAKIGGNVYFYGGEALIEGPVKGSLMGYADHFNVDAVLGGDIDIVGALALGDNAKVTGDVRYDSARELSRAPNAEIGGSISKANSSTASSEQSDGFGFSVMVIVVWFFTTLCLFFFFRRSLDQFWYAIKSNPAQSGLVGLAALLAGPILSFILIATVLGAWLGLMAIAIIIFLTLAALLCLPIMIGRFAMSYFKKGSQLDLKAVAVGMAIVVVLIYLPFLGVFILFVVLTLSLGAILLSFYRTAKDLL